MNNLNGLRPYNRAPRGRGSFTPNQNRSRFGGSRFGGGRGRGGSKINPNWYVSPAIESTEPLEVVEIKNTFSDFGFNERLMQNISARGYNIPTPIQDQGIPAMMAGSDLVGLANTGTGKTATFLLPLIHRVLEDNKQGVLIIVPTRELATQISDEFRMFAQGMNIGMTTCVGGMSLHIQIQSLRRDPHFVIATPGRLKDLIQRRAFKPELYTNIVLDEVDRMLDIGFIKDIKYIVDLLPRERHSYFFSATMTREATQLMQVFAKNPVTISVVKPVAHNQIEQDVVRVERGQMKSEVLFNMLVRPEFTRVLVFGRTKHGVDRLEAELLDRGIKVETIHGNKTQAARQKALDAFKQGKVQVLLATDVAARGIDIDNVSHVINYDEPESYEDYTHRIGRTGRAGKGGVALTFLN